ncbi:hypothetical protein [[Limnothrix rosea] IAM M-220]|nr:hypothetical protein [[Limnothrix rosea] IAM M-220]
MLSIKTVTTYSLESPPLQNGDRLSRMAFERCDTAMPQLKKSKVD